MRGDGGADTFRFAAWTDIAWDAIAEFDSGVDKIDLTGLGVTLAGSFTGVAGQLVIQNVNPGHTYLRFDTDGNSVADRFIYVTGETPIAGDFLLAAPGAPLGGTDSEIADKTWDDDPLISGGPDDSKLWSDDPLILPDLRGDEPLILPAGAEEKIVIDILDPLILPSGLESKVLADELPVICPPGEAETPVGRPDWDLAEMGLSDFGGRDPHRFTLETRALDWII